MSGHSKWHSIRHKKAITDSKRSKLFGQLSNDIAIAARKGADPSKNPALREAIERAKKANLPQANIDRLLNKDMSNLTAVTYEGYGPGGVAMLVQAETDNTNRTVAEVRALFKNHGSSLGEQGSVAWKFSPAVTASFPANVLSEEVELALIEAGADSIETSGETTTISATPSAKSDIEAVLTKHSIEVPVVLAHVVATDQKTSASEEEHVKLAELVAELDAHPDVTAVFTDVAQR